MVRVVAAIGRGFGGVLSEVGAIGLFVTKALSVGLSSFPNLRRTLEECYNIGIQSLFVVCSVGAFIGMSTALVGYATLRDLGAQNLVGIFIGIATVRELGPAVAAFMVAAKAGSGMAAHIATMRVKEQIDAMEVQAVNPFWYLIVPRFLAIMLVLPVLVIWNDFFMLGTGYLIAVFQLKVNSGAVMENLLSTVSVEDVWKGMIKGWVLALFIVSICTFKGFTCEPGALGVGKATNQAVVYCIAILIIINFFLSQWLYGGIGLRGM
jgi:phospholipid/cholesterol/gamma-HCH transport system permease protein